MSQASNLSLRASRSAQVTSRIRAASADVYDRGNLIYTLSFDVSRIHATLAAAELYLIDHPAAVPPSGTLTLTTAANTRTFDAVLLDISSSHVGLTTRHTYTLNGKRLT